MCRASSRPSPTPRTSYTWRHSGLAGANVGHFLFISQSSPHTAERNWNGGIEASSPSRSWCCLDIRTWYSHFGPHRSEGERGDTGRFLQDAYLQTPWNGGYSL